MMTARVVVPGVSETGGDAIPDDAAAEATVRVVVADDHPMWREAVARDLADAGFTRRRNGG